MKKNMILFILLFILCSCSTKPQYYSFDEVKKVVLDNCSGNMKYVGEKKYQEHDSDDNNMIYEYIFQDSRGIDFSIYSKTRHISMDASESIFYERYLSSNYIESVFNYYKKEIERKIKNMSFESCINNELLNPSISFYLDSYTQFEDASKIIVDLDKLLSYECENKIYNDISVYVYLKPDNFNDELQNNVKKYEYRIDSISFSKSKDKRLTDYRKIKSDLEYSLVNKIKIKGLTYYDIPDEILNKYSVSKVFLKIKNGDSFIDTDIILLNQNQKYVLSSFSENILFMDSYHEFRKLVEKLGGNYTYVNDKEAAWKIGNNSWNARLYEEDDVKTIVVKMNGNVILKTNFKDFVLDIDTLEKLLNISIDVNQRDAIAVIIKK